MAKPVKLSDEEQVTAHIQKFDSSFSPAIQYLREKILATDPLIGECIKWNNPCFYYTGEMKPFDPKEYKREIIVLNLHKERIMLVFPGGAKIEDKTGFLTGDYKDGRRIVVFSDLSDIKQHEALLQSVIMQWLTMVE